MFNTLARQVSPFHPAYVPAIVSKVVDMMSNRYMSQTVLQYQGCAPEFGSMYSFNLLNQIAPGNMMVQIYLGKKEMFNPS